MEADPISQLKRIHWFADLPESLLAALAQKAQKRDLHKDEVLCRKGEEGNSLFIITGGKVKIVTQDAQDNEVILNEVGAGDVIGEMALLDFEPRSAGIVTLVETSIMELNREDFMEALSGQPELGLAVIRSLISRLRHNTSHIEKITEMSRRVARGDYSFVSEAQPAETDQETASSQGTIEHLMAEFISMVRGVREREEELKQQVQKLGLQIDEAKRKQEFDEITSTDFYASLKKQAQQLRTQRKDNR